MNTVALQTDLFGNVVPTNHNGFKFCLKMHYAEKAGLHYDLRIQIPDLKTKYEETAPAKSFAIKNGLSMNPHHKPIAVLMDDQAVSGFRREGTILRGIGIGAIIHLDEGVFTIPGCKNEAELIEAFQKGLDNGRLRIVFIGHKMKGEFHFYRKTSGRYSQWIIQKANDEYVTEENILLQGRSILSDYNLQHYLDIFYKQKQIMYKLSTQELFHFYKNNDRESFKFKKVPLKMAA